jgi:hypothetical protein
MSPVFRLRQDSQNNTGWIDSQAAAAAAAAENCEDSIYRSFGTKMCVYWWMATHLE